MANTRSMSGISGTIATIDNVPNQITEDGERESTEQGPYLFLFNPDDVLGRSPLRNTPTASMHHPTPAHPSIPEGDNQRRHIVTDATVSTLDQPPSRPNQLTKQMLESLFDGVYGEVFQGHDIPNVINSHAMGSSSTPQHTTNPQENHDSEVQYSFTPGVNEDQIRVWSTRPSEDESPADDASLPSTTNVNH